MKRYTVHDYAVRALAGFVSQEFVTTDPLVIATIESFYSYTRTVHKMTRTRADKWLAGLSSAELDTLVATIKTAYPPKKKKETEATTRLDGLKEALDIVFNADYDWNDLVKTLEERINGALAAGGQTKAPTGALPEGWVQTGGEEADGRVYVSNDRWCRDLISGNCNLNLRLMVWGGHDGRRRCYIAYALGERLQGPYASLESAIQAAEGYAKGVLTQMITALGAKVIQWASKPETGVPCDRSNCNVLKRSPDKADHRCEDCGELI